MVEEEVDEVGGVVAAVAVAEEVEDFIMEEIEEEVEVEDNIEAAAAVEARCTTIREKKAPILTIFIGGNHEASQPLRELYYGGWVAPNIYYLGAAGVVRFAGLRIGGLSGIYKSHDYTQGHFESVPYDRSSLRSVYHVRNVDVLRMKCLSIGKKHSSGNRIEESEERAPRFDRPVDIMLSHDWPLGIEQHGNTNDLLRRKPYFRQEVADNNLGSPPNREVLDTVRPKHWFSAHLHVKFKATVRFPVDRNEHAVGTAAPPSSDNFMALIPSQVTDRKPKGVAENDNEVEEPSVDTPKNEQAEPSTTEFHGLETSNASCTTADGSTIEDLTEQMTRILALDKCLPRRQFLSVLNVMPPQPSAASTDDNDTALQDDKGTRKPSPYRLEYDPEWLAIVRKTHTLTCKRWQRVIVPEDPTDVISAEDLATETDWVVSRLKEAYANKQPAEGTTNDYEWLAIPTDLAPTVPFYLDSAFQ
ncbi:MAG: hypothetical protein SGILL_007050, partial [Bacillariaceae sp.]